MKRVVFFTYGAMGDFLMLLSLNRALKEKYPGIKVAAIATRNEALLRDMARGSGMRLVNLKTAGGLLALPGLLRSDAVIVPPAFGSAPNLFKRLGRLLARRGAYVGFADKGEAARFDHTLSYSLSAPYYDNMLRALDVAGLPLPAHAPVYGGMFDENTPGRLGLPLRGYIVVHPFASNPARSLPPHRWVELVDWLAAQYPQLTLVITCAHSEAPQAQSYARDKARILVGLSVAELASLVRDAKLYIGVDTGITHLAAMVRTPSVVVGNLSNPSWLPRYNPIGTILYNEARCTCRGDKTGECRAIEDGQAYFRCLYDISDNELHGAVSSKLS